MKPFPTDMFRFTSCLHHASRGCLSRAAPPVLPLESAWQKASSQQSYSSQHSSIIFWTQAGLGQFFHAAGACFLVSNQTYSMYCDFWYGPTYTQKTEATFLACKGFDQASCIIFFSKLGVFFSFHSLSVGGRNSLCDLSGQFFKL